jgi:hypothetical protein
MVGLIKWTGIFSLGGFIVLSVFAILNVVFGYNFYDMFKYYDEYYMEEKSYFTTYQEMFFIGIASLVIFFMFGGKFHHILSGKMIDEELRKSNKDISTKP